MEDRLIAEIDPSWRIVELTVSPNSRRLAYVADDGEKWHVVVDGVSRTGTTPYGRGLSASVQTTSGCPTRLARERHSQL